MHYGKVFRDGLKDDEDDNDFQHGGHNQTSRAELVLGDDADQCRGD